MQATYTVHTFHICFKIGLSDIRVSPGKHTFDQYQIIPERFSFCVVFYSRKCVHARFSSSYININAVAPFSSRVHTGAST